MFVLNAHSHLWQLARRFGIVQIFKRRKVHICLNLRYLQVPRDNDCLRQGEFNNLL